MRLSLTVVDGPALVWNGTSVKAPERFVADLKPGTTLTADCSFGKDGLALAEDPSAVFDDLPSAPQHGVETLIERGEFDVALRVLDGLAEDADTLALRALCHLERHRELDRRTSVGEPFDLSSLSRAAAALGASLKRGGPRVAISAPTSPTRLWTMLRALEKRRLAFELAGEILRWTWGAIPRSPLDDLGEFSPFTPLLHDIPSALWPRAPWLAWGLRPATIVTDEFAFALCDRLRRRSPGDRALVVFSEALRSGAKPPKGRRVGRGALGLLAGLQVAMHSSRPKPVEALVTGAIAPLPPAERLEWFSLLNESAAVAEVAWEVSRSRCRPSAPIERVRFRAIARDGTPASISRLSNGRLLAFTPADDEDEVGSFTEGDLDEVTATMPEHLFTVALMALRSA